MFANKPAPERPSYERTRTISSVTARDFIVLRRPPRINLHLMLRSVQWTDIEDYGGKMLADHLLRYPRILSRIAQNAGLGPSWRLDFIEAQFVRGGEKSRIPSNLYGTEVVDYPSIWAKLATGKFTTIVKEPRHAPYIITHENMRKLAHVCALRKNRPPP